MHPSPARQLSLCAVLAVAALVAAGCGRESSTDARHARSAPGLTTVVAGARTAPAELRVDGVVEAVHQATLSAQTSGRIAETPVDVDDRVRRGQLLLRLRATEQVAGLGQAEAALRAATARDAQARSQFERIADMYERKVVARATYDEALAARDAAAAGIAAARATLESAREGVAYTEIRAPYDGIVTSRSVQAGEAVAPGMPLLTVSGDGPLRIVASVPQSEMEQVRGLGKARVYVGSREIEATRVTVFPAADAASGTFRARVDLPDPTPGLAPGMHAKVGFVTGESSLVSVPRRAVVERSELRAVYVVMPDGQVVLRQVRLGREVGDDVEVIAGLARGERVATDPSSAAAQAVQPGPRSTAREHE